MATDAYKQLKATKPRWAAFVDHYVLHFSVSGAARAAGYNCKEPHKVKKEYIAGKRLLDKPIVRAAIDARLENRGMGKNEVLARLTEHATFDPSAFFSVDEAGKVSIDWKAANEAGFTKYLKKVTLTPRSVNLEWIDQEKALELLGRHHRLFADVSVMSDKPDQTAAELTDDQLAQIIQDSLGETEEEVEPLPETYELDDIELEE